MKRCTRPILAELCSSTRTSLRTRTTNFNVISKRFLSENCGNCRYREGCLRVEREAQRERNHRILMYILAGGCVPVLVMGVNQSGNMVDRIFGRERISLYNIRKERRDWEAVDLSQVPNDVPSPVSNLRFCGCGCGKDLLAAGQGYEVAGGQLWAKEHFRCADCGHSLVGKMRTSPLPLDAGDETWVFVKGNKLYCAHDYSAHFCSTCAHCDHQLADEFLLDPKTGRSSCVPCYQKIGEQAFATPSTSIKTRNHNKPLTTEKEGISLFEEVKEELSNLLGLDFGRRPASPLHDLQLNVVDAKEMQRIKNTSTFGKASAPSLGMTVKMLSSSMKEPAVLTTADGKEVQASGNKKQKEFYQPQRIVILEGMNKLKAGSVMAHELMHSWLAYNVLNDKERNNLLPLEVEEGLCELVAYVWLLNEKQRLRQQASAAGMEDAQIELLRLENNDDPEQGLSFHKAFRGLQGRTLNEFLTYVIKEGQFPPSLAK